MVTVSPMSSSSALSVISDTVSERQHAYRSGHSPLRYSVASGRVRWAQVSEGMGLVTIGALPFTRTVTQCGNEGQVLMPVSLDVDVRQNTSRRPMSKG